MAWFDTFANDYDNWYETKLGNFVDTVEKRLIEDMAGFKTGEKVLDLGSGTGNYSIWLAKKGLYVTGVDKSTGMMNIAKKKALDDNLFIDWVEADAVQLPFPNESFDLVLSVTAIEFMDDIEVVLMEALRVLKTNGRLIIGVLTKNSPWGELYQKMAEADKNNLFAKAHLFLEEDLSTLLPLQYKLKKGLYMPPVDEFDEEEASRIETSKQLEQAGNAGFFVVRWDRRG